jgi:hypothetical protein
MGVGALSADDLGQEVDALHALPLSEFIPARDALVRRLRGEGRRDEAAEVGRLRRPTVPAWGVNRAVREAPEETEALLAAGEALRTAQAALLRGGDAGDMREAQAAARAAEAAMLARVRSILDEAKRGGQGALERVRETLHAAVVDEAAAARLREGRLATELTAAGLGGGFGVADDLAAERPSRRSRAAAEPEPEPERPRRTASRAPARPSAAEDRGRRKAEAALEALEAARRDVADAEAGAEAAAAAVAEAEAERTRAEEARAEADRAVAAAAGEVKARAAGARAGERALSAARAALARAERAAERAEADLEAERGSG